MGREIRNSKFAACGPFVKFVIGVIGVRLASLRVGVFFLSKVGLDISRHYLIRLLSKLQSRASASASACARFPD